MVRDILAGALAYLLHPLPITVIAVFALLRSALPLFETLMWGGVVLGALFLPLITTLLIGHRTGRYDSVLLDRDERQRMYGIGAVTMTITTAALWWSAAPQHAIHLSAVIAAYTLVAAGINRYVKISVHAAAVTGGTIILASQRPLLMFPGLVVVIGICWSRVHEEKHTVREVALGVVVGALVTAPLLVV